MIFMKMTSKCQNTSNYFAGYESGVSAAGALGDGGHVRPAEGARPAGDRQAQEQGRDLVNNFTSLNLV